MINRREFLGAAGFTALLCAFGGLRGASPPYSLPDARRRGLLRPPGSIGEDEFLSRCIRCQRCAEACEADAIRLMSPGHGRRDATPFIVAEDRACTLCLKCGPACPTGAIAALVDKRDARMGLAVVDERLCVSHNGTGICGACHTVCPLRGKAITQGRRNAPTVHAEECVGCGLCEEACIVHDDRDGRAIRVRSGRAWA